MKSKSNIEKCADAIMALDFPTPTVRKNWLCDQLPNFSYHYIVAAVDLLVNEGKLKRISYRNTSASPVMKSDCEGEYLGGHCLTNTTDIGRIRTFLYSKKTAGEEFFAYELVKALGVNSGLTVFEIKRLEKIGEVEKSGLVDKDETGRKLPSPRQLYRFV